MPNLLYQITGPSFSAGLVVTPDGQVIKAAPILHVWEGQRLDDVLAWIDRSPPGKYHVRLVGHDPQPYRTPTQVSFTPVPSRQRHEPPDVALASGRPSVPRR